MIQLKATFDKEKFLRYAKEKLRAQVAAKLEQRDKEARIVRPLATSDLFKPSPIIRTSEILKPYNPLKPRKKF